VGDVKAIESSYQHSKEELEAGRARVTAAKSARRAREEKLENRATEVTKRIGNVRTTIAKISERKSAIAKQIARLRAAEGKCPQCRQPVTREWIDAQSESLLETQVRLAERLQLRQGRLKVLEGKLKRLENRVLRLEERGDEEAAELSHLEVAFAQAEAGLRVVRQRQEAEQDRLVRVKELEVAVKLHKSYRETLEDYRLFLNLCEGIFHRNGLPAFLVASLCPRLNQAAAVYSQAFTGGEICVRFALTTEQEVDVQVENQHGGRGVGDQSQGELRMASLVTAFALREVTSGTNILILDEPGEGLDAGNACAFAQGLKDVAGRFGSVWITTHNPNILAELSDVGRHLEVVKQGGISSIEEARA
jgi:DNA repair exonuclease SbcCD ATPase subunit